eukprot:8504501-Pyramimonas_sp.AAC.2
MFGLDPWSLFSQGKALQGDQGRGREGAQGRGREDDNHLNTAATQRGWREGELSLPGKEGGIC